MFDREPLGSEKTKSEVGKSDMTERPPSEITFVKSRMFYARRP